MNNFCFSFLRSGRQKHRGCFMFFIVSENLIHGLWCNDNTSYLCCWADQFDYRIRGFSDKNSGYLWLKYKIPTKNHFRMNISQHLFSRQIVPSFFSGLCRRKSCIVDFSWNVLCQSISILFIIWCTHKSDLIADVYGRGSFLTENFRSV